MASALDVAAYIVELAEQIGEVITNMKLQKILYYSYAWYSVEVENREQLFPEPIEAWPYGPVIRAVYEVYKSNKADNIKQPEGDGESRNLSEVQRKIVEEVFLAYGKRSASELVDMTHNERPWSESYNPDYQREIIPSDLIYSFFADKKRQMLSDQN